MALCGENVKLLIRTMVYIDSMSKRKVEFKEFKQINRPKQSRLHITADNMIHKLAASWELRLKLINSRLGAIEARIDQLESVKNADKPVTNIRRKVSDCRQI
jgi:hypothetical protein